MKYTANAFPLYTWSKLDSRKEGGISDNINRMKLNKFDSYKVKDLITAGKASAKF